MKVRVAISRAPGGRIIVRRVGIYHRHGKPCVIAERLLG
jgi:hypothetical protein